MRQKLNITATFGMEISNRQFLNFSSKAVTFVIVFFLPALFAQTKLCQIIAIVSLLTNF